MPWICTPLTASGHVSGELYIINSSTGAVMQNIGPLNDTNSLNYAMTGLAFDPVSGALYESARPAVLIHQHKTYS